MLGHEIRMLGHEIRVLVHEIRILGYEIRILEHFIKNELKRSRPIMRESSWGLYDHLSSDCRMCSVSVVYCKMQSSSCHAFIFNPMPCTYIYVGARCKATI